jgi:hypothetical protein
MVADSVSGFSGEQGANGWSYGYWDHTADPDKSYDQATDFQLLRRFGSDPLDRVAGPGWKRHAFGGGAKTVLEMLDDALASQGTQDRGGIATRSQLTRSFSRR